MFAKMPTAIAPEDDNGVVVSSIDRPVEDATDEGIGVGYATRIVATHLKGKGVICVGVMLPTIVFPYELTRSQRYSPEGLRG